MFAVRLVGLALRVTEVTPGHVTICPNPEITFGLTQTPSSPSISPVLPSRSPQSRDMLPHSGTSLDTDLVDRSYCQPRHGMAAVTAICQHTKWPHRDIV